MPEARKNSRKIYRNLCTPILGYDNTEAFIWDTLIWKISYKNQALLKNYLRLYQEYNKFDALTSF
jgi:hypothetical protein